MAMIRTLNIDFFRLNACTVCYLFFVAHTGIVRAEAPIAWKMGREFSKTLQNKVGFRWLEQPLKVGLGNLAKEYQIAIWLDRRIDPGKLITFATSDQPLDTAFQRLADELDLSHVTVGDVVYFGPPGAAAKLRAMIYLRKLSGAALSKEARVRWNDPFEYSWEERAEPRALIQKLAGKLGVMEKHAVTIPHDLWSSWQGPRMSGAEWLSLLLIGFEQTFELAADGKSIAIVPLPDKIAYEEIHTIVGDQVRIGKELKKLFPDVVLRREGTSKIGVTASAEQQLQIAGLLAGQDVVVKGPVKPGIKRFSLTVENQPRGAVLKTIAAELGVTLHFDAALNQKLQERVTLAVKQVSAEELLQQVLNPAELRGTIRGEKLEIEPLAP